MYLQLKKSNTNSESLKSKTRHLSRFCYSKVTDNVSKVYLTQNVWLNAHMIARLTSLPWVMDVRNLYVIFFVSAESMDFVKTYLNTNTEIVSTDQPYSKTQQREMTSRLEYFLYIPRLVSGNCILIGWKNVWYHYHREQCAISTMHKN